MKKQYLTVAILWILALLLSYGIAQSFTCYLAIPNAQVQSHYLRLKASTNYFPISKVQHFNVYDGVAGSIYHCFFSEASLYFFDTLAYFLQETDYTVDDIHAANATVVNDFVTGRTLWNGKTMLQTSNDRLRRKAGSLVGQDREWLAKAYLLNILNYDSSVYVGTTRQDIFNRWPALEGTKTITWTAENGTEMTREVPKVKKHEWR